VAAASNVTSLPVGQLAADKLVCGQGSVIDEFEALIETIGGRREGN
jgi:hypothetical protein